MKKKILLLLIILLSFITTNVYAEPYSGDYSLEEMLKNYNVISFGKKDLDSHMPTTITYGYNNNSLDFNKGDVNIFHINSKFLVNGNLRIGRLDLYGGEAGLKSYFNNITYMSSNNSNGYVDCGYCGG